MKDEEALDKKSQIYGELCDLIYSLDYHDQLELLNWWEQDIDLLRLHIKTLAKIKLSGRKPLDKTIQLGDSVYVSDPCYSTDVWCLAKIDNVLPGEYVCFRTIMSTSWDLRVSEISVVHKDYVDNTDEINYEELDYDIGVDSGQCGIYDANYYKSKHNDTRDENYENWYNKVCKITLNFAGTIDGSALVSDSGYGDGSYCLYAAKSKSNKIIALKVVFIDENEEKEEEIKPVNGGGA